LRNKVKENAKHFMISFYRGRCRRL